jgi:hypothetical protein
MKWNDLPHFPHLSPLLDAIAENTRRAIDEDADDDDAMRKAERRYHDPRLGAGGASTAQWDREGRQ